MQRICRLIPLIMPIISTTIFGTICCAQITLSDNAVPYKSITPQVETTIEKTAVIALRHISKARADIHRKAFASAKLELIEAARLMETIRDDLSTATVKSLIQVTRKHIEFEQAQKIIHELPQIYSSLEMISVYLPTDKTKLHIDRAKGFLERNDKRGAEIELAIADKSLIIIEVELPLLKVQHYVAKAQGYLVAKNAGKADKALQAAEQRAMALYTLLNSPIYQVKQSAWQAFRNYSTATHAETAAHLARARNYLNIAATGGNRKVKEEANKISAELNELEKKLTGEEKVAESELKAAWEKSKALSERSAAYLSASLSEAETTLGVEDYLIEAKLHVTYAETYQVTTSEPDKAVKELDTAISYLQKATANTLTDSADRKKIKELRNILLVLKLTPKENDITVQDRYDAVKDELNNLSINQ